MSYLGLATGFMSVLGSYQQAKYQKKLFEMKAKAAQELGEYNSTITINNTIGKVNELSSQSNIIAANNNRFLDESARKFSEMYEKMADEYSTLVLKSRGNYSSYDYLKSVEKDAHEKAADMDYQISQGTYQADVQQTELARKTKLTYDLGLANADMVKYKANLSAYGLQAQGGIAEAKGFNTALASTASIFGDYSTYRSQGAFDNGFLKGLV
jgi:hypothetical protein